MNVDAIADLADDVERQGTELEAIRRLYRTDDRHLADYVAGRVLMRLDQVPPPRSARCLIVAELRNLATGGPAWLSSPPGD